MAIRRTRVPGNCAQSRVAGVWKNGQDGTGEAEGEVGGVAGCSEPCL